MLHFLDRFAKEYGESKVLGEEFVTAVVNVELSMTDKVPYVRAALVATNLVAEKVVDGIARLLYKSDVERLKTNALKQKGFQLDKSIKSAWDAAMAAMNGGKFGQQDFDAILGKFMVRATLDVFGKQKLGPESISRLRLSQRPPSRKSLHVFAPLKLAGAGGGIFGGWGPSKASWIF